MTNTNIWPSTRRDWLILSTVYLFMILINVSTVLSYRATQRAVERAAITRTYLDDLMRSTGICTLRASGAVNTEEIPYTPEAIETYYNECLQSRVPKKG